MLFVAAGFTAFYMWRQIEMVFHGKPRSEAAAHAPESARSMTFSLQVLGFFSIFVGFISIPSGMFLSFLGAHRFGDFLGHTFFSHALSFNTSTALLALGLGLTAIVVAHRIYGNNKALNAKGHDPLMDNVETGPFWKLAHARLYWDETYFRLFENPYNRFAGFLANTVDWDFLHNYFHESILKRGYNALGDLLSKPVDLGIVDGAVNGTGQLVKAISARMRRLQTGYVRVYTVTLFLGAVIVIILMLLPLIKFG